MLASQGGGMCRTGKALFLTDAEIKALLGAAEQFEAEYGFCVGEYGRYKTREQNIAADEAGRDLLSYLHDQLGE